MEYLPVPGRAGLAPGVGGGGEGGLTHLEATSCRPQGQPWAGRRSLGVGQPQEATVWAPRCQEAEGEVAALGIWTLLDL